MTFIGSYRFKDIVFVIFGGLMAACGAVSIAFLSVKAIAALAGIFIMTVFMVVAGKTTRDSVLCFLMVFFTPLYLDFNLFVHKHVGGAASISVSVAWLAALVLLAERLAGSHRNLEHGMLFGRELVPIFLYIFCGFLSLINAAYPNLVYLEVIRLIMLTVVMLAVLNISDRKMLDRVVFFIIVAVGVQSLLAVVQFSVKNFPSMDMLGIKTAKELFPGQRIHRSMGTLGHPNFLGYYLEMTLPVVLGIFIVVKRRLFRLFTGLVFLAGTMALLLSKSRGAWIGYPFAVGFTILLTYGREILTKSILHRVLIAVTMTIFIVAAFSPAIKDRLVGRDYQALYVRMPLNKAALSIMEQFPLIGVGMNNFSEVFKEYDTTGYSRIFKGYKHVVHNLYLLVGVETGILGLLCFMAIFLVPLFYALKILFHTRDAFIRAVVSGGSMGLVAHLIHGLIDPGFIVSTNASFLVFFLIGLIGAYSRQAAIPSEGFG